MPTKNPRIHVVLEKPLFNHLKGLARRNGLSMSLEARELIKEAFRSTGKRLPRLYTGKHLHALIGRFRMGKKPDGDAILADQAHG